MAADNHAAIATDATVENTTLGDFVTEKPHPCPSCDAAFGSGPALGGHLGYCRSDDDRPWRDQDLLEELYHGEEDLQLHEIADRFGVDYRTIWNAFDEFEIERDQPGGRNPGVYFETYQRHNNHLRGYERWVTAPDEEGTRQNVRVHRLAAVAWHGFDAVAGNDVHHDLPFQWLNTEWNLQPIDHTEHSSIESKRYWADGNDPDPEVDRPGYEWAGIER